MAEERLLSSDRRIIGSADQNKIRSEDGWFSQLDNISQDSFKLFGRSELFTNLSASYHIGFLPGILQGMCIFVIVFSTLLISSVMQLIFFGVQIRGF